MEKTTTTRWSNQTNTFGQTTYREYTEESYIGTPAELAELVKRESYVYLKMPKMLKRNSALMEELAALNLLPTRKAWESDETYWDGWNLIVYIHGEAECRDVRDYTDLSPVFRFEGAE